MSISDTVSASVSAALDAIINTKIYYRDNKITLIQSGIILLLPQITAYVLQYNAEFGIKFQVQLDNYPLLLFVFLVVMVFVLIEPAVTEKSGEVISKIAFLSIHLFAFALSLNLIYAVLVPVLGFTTDPIAGLISNFATWWPGLLGKPAFAMLYGIPFLVVAIFLVVLNSYYLYPEGQFKNTIKSRLFWESFLLAISLAFYQYAAFILVGKAAA